MAIFIFVLTFLSGNGSNPQAADALDPINRLKNHRSVNEFIKTEKPPALFNNMLIRRGFNFFFFYKIHLPEI